MKKNLNLPKKKTGRLRNLFLTVCLLASVAASAQEKTVTGTVTDALGDPLIGATVLVQGTSNGVITDIDGRYSIQATPENTLDFSYVGMVKQAVKVGNRSIIRTARKDCRRAGDKLRQGRLRPGNPCTRNKLHQRLQATLCGGRTVQRQHQLPESAGHRIHGDTKRPVVARHLRCARCQRRDYHHHQEGERGTDTRQYQRLVRFQVHHRQNCTDGCRRLQTAVQRTVEE